MLTHQSAASAINLIDEENEQAPRPVEAEALPGNAMDDAVMRVIARVEQALGAWRFSAADQDMHVRADRLRLAARRDQWSAAEREARRAAQQERIHRRLPAVDTASQLGTRPVSTPIPACSEQRPLAPYLHQRLAAPYLHRTPAAPFAWVAPFALSAARSMPTRWSVGSTAYLAQVST